MTPARCAFTLVELLITIAVIAVLIALSLGPLHAVRDSGRQIRCVTHLRTLHAAVELYRNDNKALLPLATSVANLYPSWIVQPYDALADTLRINLPSAGTTPVEAPEPLWCSADHLGRNQTGISYIYMPWELMAAWPGANVQRSVTLALDRTPDEPLFWERSSLNHIAGAVGRVDIRGNARMHRPD
ncbi:MAG TPA: type II secretion system protein [Phycisphaerales bacterium]|nr:type II secretion system protein [Phycisphaerales bacterium]